MTSQVQKRRGTTSEHSTFTGAEGEITVDTTKDTAVVHDGVTTGGRPLAREDLNNVAASTVAAKLSGTGLSSVDINSGNIDGTAIGATTPSTGAFTTLSTTGNITTSGTVDGRDVAADGTKLDGIESGADVTDTTNVTAAGALMDSELTDITAVKALDQGVATTDSPTFSNVTSDIDLTAIAASKTDTAVDVFVYDTSKDSDGGAWRKRCQHTSWYNETLNTATRGSRKEFPAVAVIVAEATKVTIYDGDDPTLPMWMVFLGGTATSLLGTNSTSTAGSISMLNGVLCFGNKGAANEYQSGLGVVEFIIDRASIYRGAALDRYLISDGQVVNRNYDGVLGALLETVRLASGYINDVAMTVLPSAPIDAYGMPIPTIACATDGGVSVIKDDGTVVDIVSGGVSAVSVINNGLSIVQGQVLHIGEIPATDYVSLASWRTYSVNPSSSYPCVLGGITLITEHVA